MEDISPFCEWPLIPLFGTSSDVSSGFQSQSGQHLAGACVIYIHLASGETRANLLVASMVAEPISQKAKKRLPGVGYNQSVSILLVTSFPLGDAAGDVMGEFPPSRQINPSLLSWQVRIQDLVKGGAPASEAESCRRSGVQSRE